MEEWRDVVGFEGIYQVSNQGRVRSVDRIDSAGKRQRGKLKRTKTNNRGYHQVHLYKNNIVNYLLSKNAVKPLPLGMGCVTRPQRSCHPGELTSYRWTASTSRATEVPQQPGSR